LNGYVADDLGLPLITLFYAFCVVFRVAVMGEDKNFKFDKDVVLIKINSQRRRGIAPTYPSLHTQFWA